MQVITIQGSYLHIFVQWQTNYSFFPHWEGYNGMASYITQLFLWLEVFHPQKYIILDENVSVLLWIFWKIGHQFKQTVHQNLHR